MLKDTLTFQSIKKCIHLRISKAFLIGITLDVFDKAKLTLNFDLLIAQEQIVIIDQQFFTHYCSLIQRITHKIFLMGCCS